MLSFVFDVSRSSKKKKLLNDVLEAVSLTRDGAGDTVALGRLKKLTLVGPGFYLSEHLSIPAGAPLDLFLTHLSSSYVDHLSLIRPHLLPIYQLFAYISCEGTPSAFRWVTTRRRGVQFTHFFNQTPHSPTQVQQGLAALVAALGRVLTPGQIASAFWGQPPDVAPV
jgi:hypothetical protein